MSKALTTPPSLSELFLRDNSKLTVNSLYTLKRSWAKELGTTPRDSDVLAVYRDLAQKGLIESSPDLARALITRRVRTMSGVTPFAVMTKPYVCPGQCTFCPLELGMPKSYLSDEPAAARARMMNFDPRAQIESRLKQLEDTGHETDKIELIVIGGTFSNYPRDYKRAFFKDMIDTINGVVSASLEQAQVYNETAPRRIVGISIETRPDWIDETEVRLLRELGVTKVQVGVQAFDEEILRRVNRGHSLSAVASATQLLKDAGIKVCYHFMPNLPDSTPQKDLAMARLMYEDPRFKPDFLKVYPAQVIPGTEMFREWERGEYVPYSEDKLVKVLKEIKKFTPPYVRIDRLVRDISKKWVAAGTRNTNMRQVILRELKNEGFACRCIRCREARGHVLLGEPELHDLLIETLGAEEHLLTYEQNNRLYSLLRLRLHTGTPLFPELLGAAIIREVHTYGVATKVGEHKKSRSQHHGLGSRLIKHAEELAAGAGYKRIAVISSIGTRSYYHKFGYSREGTYMVKNI